MVFAEVQHHDVFAREGFGAGGAGDAGLDGVAGEEVGAQLVLGVVGAAAQRADGAAPPRTRARHAVHLHQRRAVGLLKPHPRTQLLAHRLSSGEEGGWLYLIGLLDFLLQN